MSFVSDWSYLNLTTVKCRLRRILPKWIFAMLFIPISSLTSIRELSNMLGTAVQNATASLATSLVKQYVQIHISTEEVDKTINELEETTKTTNLLLDLKLRYWGEIIQEHTTRLDEQSNGLIAKMENISLVLPNLNVDEEYTPDIAFGNQRGLDDNQFNQI